jgi:hypothetical protein
MARPPRARARRVTVCVSAVGVVVLVVAAIGEVSAEPRARLEVTGACPTVTDVRAALEPYFEITDDRDAPWLITVRAEAGQSRLQVRHGESTALDRTVASVDCRAVAAAYAVIVHAHLRGIEPPAAPAAPTATAVVAVEPVAAAAGSATATTIATGPRRGDRGFVLGVGGGAGVGAAPRSLVGFGTLELGWAPRRGGGLVARAAFEIDTPDEIGPESAVSRHSGRLRIDLGYRRPAGLVWLQATGGVGVDLGRVRAPEVTDPSSAWRFHPAIWGTGGIGRSVSRRWSVRLDVRVGLYPLQDRYVIEPIGGVARTSRALLGAALGAEWTASP